MTFENCLDARNQTLMRLFNANEANPDAVGADGRTLSSVLQDLPVCDLQEELDNVIIAQPDALALKNRVKSPLFIVCRRHRERDWRLSSARRL